MSAKLLCYWLTWRQFNHALLAQINFCRESNQRHLDYSVLANPLHCASVVLPLYDQAMGRKIRLCFHRFVVGRAVLMINKIMNKLCMQNMKSTINYIANYCDIFQTVSSIFIFKIFVCIKPPALFAAMRYSELPPHIYSMRFVYPGASMNRFSFLWTLFFISRCRDIIFERQKEGSKGIYFIFDI